MPKAKPISLFPLNFDEALDALLSVPMDPKPKRKPRKKKRAGTKAKKRPSRR